MVGLAVVIAAPALKGTNLRGLKNPIFGEKKIPSLKGCKKIRLDSLQGENPEKIVYLVKKPHFRVFLGSNGHFFKISPLF